MGIVDAHVHFWDRKRLRYPWLDHVPGLQQSFTPDEYDSATAGISIDAILAVEANCLPRDNINEVAYFASLDARADVAGIVAYVDFTRPRDAQNMIAALAELPKAKGVRQNIQGQPRGFGTDDAFVDGVRMAGANGFTFDICITHDQCGDATQLVSRCPDTTFILDHCGKPAIRDRCLEPWTSDIARLAECENVHCKLSGLLTEASPEWSELDLWPYAARVAECFGADRLMYGSDWPVMTLSGRYEEWFDFTQAFTATWSQSALNAFYRDNATRVYQL